MPRPQGMRWIRHEKRCAIYARDAFRCLYCLEAPTWLMLDHVEPFGGNGEDNLATACDDCNQDKGDRSLGAWLLAREARGDDPEWLALIQQRVALQTFLPIDLELGKRLERRRGRGPGSFAALAPLLEELAAESSSSARSEVSDAA